MPIILKNNKGFTPPLTNKSTFTAKFFSGHSSRAGFTLVEALVALVILTMALGPILFSADMALNISNSIRNNLIAANLSQEGLEVVRAIRDANWFNDRAFDSGLSDGVWRVEWNSDSLLPRDDNTPLKINNGVYSYSPLGTNTIFKRTITITKVNAGELKIVCEVSWKDRNINKSVSAESHLFDWK